jgi:hypothetical protein
MSPKNTLIKLSDELDTIADALGTNPDSDECWSAYRRIRKLAREKLITAEKQGKSWLVNEAEFHDCLKKIKESMPKKNKIESKEISVDDIRTLITEMEEIQVDSQKILLLLKKRLGI